MTATAMVQQFIAQEMATAAPLTLTPAAEETAFQLTQAAHPTRAVVNSTPTCVPGQGYTKCHDQVLAIDFEYPSAWGEIGAQLFTGYTSGYGYEYSFTAKTWGLQAGGRSRDFSEPRGGTLTDFRGVDSDPAPPTAVCSNFGAALCNQISADVVFIVTNTTAQIVCDPGPGSLDSPTGIVTIYLPQGLKVNGFIFSSDILSDKLSNELSVLADPDYNARLAKCKDPVARQLFDAKVKEIIDAIRAGTVDAATQDNINRLMHVAQSIRFD